MYTNSTKQTRYQWLFGLTMPIWPFVSYALFTVTGNPISWWLSAIVFVLATPLLDYVLGSSDDNLDEETSAQLAADPYYRRIVYLFPLLQWLSLLFGLWVASSGLLTGWAWLAWALALGNINGTGINAAHELGHKRDKLSRNLAKLALIPSGYGHFIVEHNRGHHVKVATPEDPASARLGESFWRFLPRTILGSAVSAWQLEQKKLQRQQLSVWHWRNENLQGWACSFLLLLTVLLVAGWAVALLLVVQAIHALSLLEVINYVEHYGLKRQKLANGRYEPCSPEHSWNSNTVYSNIGLFQLQRHSDHHANPMRPYQILRHFNESPQLPTGYASMMLLAYIPPLWFREMDKRVEAHYGGDLTLANRLERKPEAQTSAGEGLIIFIEQRIALMQQQLQGLFH